MTTGSCPLVICLRKSCRRFEHSYTVALGSINDSDTDRKWLLKEFSVRFLWTSAEVERCPFVSTFRARHTDALLLSRSMSFWEYSFLAFLTRFVTLFLNFLYSGKHFSLFSLFLSAIVSLMFLLSHGGNFRCFTGVRLKGACLLTTVSQTLYHVAKAVSGSVQFRSLQKAVI